MMPTPWLETQSRVRCRRWLAADSDGACLMTPLVQATMPKVTAIALPKPPIAQSPLNSQPTRAAKSVASPIANTTRTPKPPAKSP
jgi:hypothetical protein